MKPITSGQKEQTANVVKDAARKATEESVAELEASGTLNGDNIQRIQGDPRLSARVKDFVKNLLAELAENISGIVKLISGAETLELDETDGKETIAKAKDTFPGYIDGDFKGWGCDVKSEPTKKTQVSVYEMIKDGTFAQIWNGMSNDLNSLCLTQSQIIQFVQKHRKWLRTEGYGTFFLFKVRNEFLAADVSFDGYGRPGVGVDRFSSGYVWDAGRRRRVVIPQLTPTTT